ncbi:2Fe-2S iron-sulfur cluster-binding protein [Paenibacillus sp. XY044]|uniref:2Fe-2S iron-sulfur cluster-binding protein n=1 Tax=Paenibacillus sp. XY044 TaxID=2026089 RepID=UPI000B990CFC|nr:2Fe-2S iron-sulfur cluster-binding protein [Paenibacillus sp. XY044]OZB94850.1 ferredoxin [Paenibacillus sp. XY044]
MNHKVTFEPSGKSVLVREGMSLLHAAREAGVYIPTRCGGKMGCLMCKVQVGGPNATQLSPPDEAEKRKLGSLIHSGTRLSCQARVRGPVTVTVPEDKLKAAVRKQLEAARNRDREDDLW